MVGNMVKGNQKGNSFEREMCRQFSLWYSGGKLDDLFWRTSGSGSRATNRHIKGKDLTKFQHGDMTHVRPEGRPLTEHISFEFKSYAGIDFHGIFHTVSPENSLLSFWAKCVRDAEESGRLPFLVTKVLNGHPTAWVPRVLLEIFMAWGYHVGANRGVQFWVPPCEVVTKRTYPRRAKGAAKKKAGKGKPKLEKYTFKTAQCVVGISLDAVFKSLGTPEDITRRLAAADPALLPIPRREDPTDGRA
jgi:hypothetical protein